MAANKNTIPGDMSAMNPGGIRMGTPALTTRGFTEEDFEQVGIFFDRSVAIALDIKAKTGSKLKDFKTVLETEESISNYPELLKLRKDVTEFSRKFPTIGF